MKDRKTILAFLLVLAHFAGGAARASNCAIRNPDRQIFEIFPEASRYRTVLGHVGTGPKRDLEQILGKALAFSDLGRTSMCIVMHEGAPVGFVHARAEIGAFGATEIVWALDLDLRVRDFRIQRSRSAFSDRIRGTGFRELVLGKNRYALHELVNKADRLNLADAVGEADEAQQLARRALLSGLKTIVLLEKAFEQTLMSARRRGNAARFFPEYRTMEETCSTLDQDAREELTRRLGAHPRHLDPNRFCLLVPRDARGQRLGTLAVSDWASQPGRPRAWWAMDPGGRILTVSVDGETEPALAAHLDRLAGRTLAELADETGPAARFGREMLVAVAAALEEERP